MLKKIAIFVRLKAEGGEKNMLDFEENKKNLAYLQNKIKELGESL